MPFFASRRLQRAEAKERVEVDRRLEQNEKLDRVTSLPLPRVFSAVFAAKAVPLPRVFSAAFVAKTVPFIAGGFQATRAKERARKKLDAQKDGACSRPENQWPESPRIVLKTPQNPQEWPESPRIVLNALPHENWP